MTSHKKHDKKAVSCPFRGICTHSAEYLSLGLAVCVAASLGLPLKAQTFDSNSATINNRYYPLKVGAKFTYAGFGVNQGETSVSKATSVELMDGVNCIKVENTTTWGWSHEWFAQDTAGNVWRLREYGEDYLPLPNVPDEEDYLIMPAAPQVGAFYSLWILDYRVVSTSAAVTVPAKKYTNCLHLQCVDEGWPDEQEFYAPGVGSIKFFDSEGGWELKSVKGLPASGSGGPGGASGGDDPGGLVGAARLASYDGFFNGPAVLGSGESAAVRGTLSLKVSGVAGKLTAKVVLQRGTLSFKASAWTSVAEDGTCRVTLPGKVGETLDLYVSENRVWGTLTGGTLGVESYELEGARNRFADRADTDAQTMLAGLSGYYTVALPVADARSVPDEVAAAPLGAGYLTVTIGAGGKAKIAGVLADGSKVSQACQLLLADGEGPLGQLPLFVPLYAKTGWVGGILRISPESRTIITATGSSMFVNWERPGPIGFKEQMVALGGFYSSGATLAAAYQFTADAGDVSYHTAQGPLAAVAEALPAGLAVVNAGGKLTPAKGKKPVKISEAGEIRYEYEGENCSLATLSFAVRTGLFKGKFNLYYDGTDGFHKAVGVSYAGVMTPVRDAAFKDRPAGLGYCLVPDNDPAFRAYRMKRSFPVWLEAAEQ